MMIVPYSCVTQIGFCEVVQTVKRVKSECVYECKCMIVCIVILRIKLLLYTARGTFNVVSLPIPVCISKILEVVRFVFSRFGIIGSIERAQDAG